MNPEQSTDSRKEFEYVYHWDRIAGVVVTLALLVGALVWILSGDGEATGSSTASSITAGTAPARSEQAPAPADTPALPAATTDVSATGAASSPSGTEGSIASGSQDTASGGSGVEAKQAVTPVDTHTSVAASNPDQPAGSISKDLLQGEVRVVSARVTSAALNQIIDQELIPIPKGVIDVGQRKAVRLVFSAQIPAPGEAVNVIWFHEGRQVVTVKTKVTPESTVTGSKYVSFDTPGMWQVKLTDSQGSVLAEAAVRARRR
jgi:hypothetical protein